jgi:hypothetical protein
MKDLMRFEIVTSCGRGTHLANPGQGHAICMRPVMARTGCEGSAKTPFLCQAWVRALAHALQTGRSK